MSRLSGGGTSFDDACDAGAQNLEPRAVQQTLILTSVGVCVRCVCLLR